MRILSIETSCDETAIALLEISGPLEKPKISVLGNSLLSQAKLHEEYGGVYPSLAKREHIKNLPILLEKTLKEAHVDKEYQQIDFIAVTAGPGLEPALWAGITFAQELGKKWNKPVIPVNHMEGHVFSVLYGLEDGNLELPALALLISGGHTELVHIKDFGHYEIIGKTLDDAAGEAFDKVARMLDLTYPGGPKISALAKKDREKGEPDQLIFPRPMINSGNLDFSFSGLKTAVLYKVKAIGRKDEAFKEMVARSFEDAVGDVLVSKSKKALESAASGAKTFIVAGGVSANSYLKERFKKLAAGFPSLKLRMPENSLSTDNAIMIGIAAYIRISLDKDLADEQIDIKAEGNLSIDS